MAGVPMGKITGWTFALVALFVIAGVVLTVTGHSDQANGALGTATGIVVGAGTAVTVTVRQYASDKRDAENDATPSGK